MTTSVAVSKAPLKIWVIDDAVGLGAGANVTNTFGLLSFANGRIRGNFHSDQDGALLIEQGNSLAVMDLSFNATRDATQPDFQWPFDVIIIQPFVRLTFTNGGVPSTFLRASVVALPF